MREFPPCDVKVTIFTKRCTEKTQNGNVYNSHEKAEAVANELSVKHKVKIVAFLCPVCHLFHVGKQND